MSPIRPATSKRRSVGWQRSYNVMASFGPSTPPPQRSYQAAALSLSPHGRSRPVPASSQGRRGESLTSLPSSLSYSNPSSPRARAHSPGNATFAEIARGVIMEETSNTVNPFARARARAALEALAKKKKEARKKRKVVATFAVFAILILCAIFYLGLCLGASFPVAGQPQLLPKGQKAPGPPDKSTTAKDPPNSTRGVPFLVHLSADLPAIAASKAQLGDALRSARIRAQPRQLDEAWVALTSGNGVPPMAPVALMAALALRNPGMTLGTLFFGLLFIVLMAGMVVNKKNDRGSRTSGSSSTCASSSDIRALRKRESFNRAGGGGEGRGVRTGSRPGSPQGVLVMDDGACVQGFGG